MAPPPQQTMSGDKNTQEKQQRPARCLTCRSTEHIFTECENECKNCGHLHPRGICPVLPNIYPTNGPSEAKLGSILDRMKLQNQAASDKFVYSMAKLESATALLKTVMEDVPAAPNAAFAMAKPPKGKAAVKVKGPPQEQGTQRRDAEDLIGKAFKDWVPGWSNKSAGAKSNTRRLTNAYCAGTKKMPLDCPLANELRSQGRADPFPEPIRIKQPEDEVSDGEGGEESMHDADDVAA